MSRLSIKVIVARISSGDTDDERLAQNSGRNDDQRLGA